ncbi:TPA: hypothetical protein ACX6O9_000584 [Photobacterium damselae]
MSFPYENLGVILGSGLFGSLVTVIFNRYDSDKKIIIENITKERQKWRESIRNLVLEVNEYCNNNDFKKINSIQAQFQVLINPYDNNDKKIIELLGELQKGDNTREVLPIFNDSISKLLKHDWDRVKKEAGFFVSSKRLALATLILWLYLYISEHYFNINISKINEYPLHILIFMFFVMLSLPSVYRIFIITVKKLVPFDISNKISCWLLDEPYRQSIKSKTKTKTKTKTKIKTKCYMRMFLRKLNNNKKAAIQEIEDAKKVAIKEIEDVKKTAIKINRRRKKQ